MKRIHLSTIAVLSALLPFAGAAAATESVLYSFTGGADGAFPRAGLIMDSGALYGTTEFGGAGNRGTVFELTRPAAGGRHWTKTVLHSFTGGADGAHPMGTLLKDNAGALYGTTEVGGTGWGTVFKLTPAAAGQTAWTESVLYRFTGGTDGKWPNAGLIAKHGVLYGTTPNGGGTGRYGTVFKLRPPAAGQTAWTESVLHSFTGGADGRSPAASLIIDSSGALYGTTYLGGNRYWGGTAFKLTPPAAGQTAWTETVLYSFGGGTDASDPHAGLIMDSSGVLYGTTFYGGSANLGAAFKLTPPAAGQTAWTETVLHSFTGGTDGNYPKAGLIVDSSGVLYGTTPNGGGTANSGTVFKLTPPATGQTAWTETVLHRFTGSSDGGLPWGDALLATAGLLANKSGFLFGTTYDGGAGNSGTVFKVVVP